MKPCRAKRSSGFSLVEMAIVLIIFTLLAGGMMMTLTTQQEIQRLNEVRRQLADIREALLGYVAVNGKFPLPAQPTTPSGAAGAGLSDNGFLTVAADFYQGVLPWATLGLPETDPWGQRFTYVVSKIFTTTGFVSASGGISSSGLNAKGAITVRDKSANSIATGVPAVIISHGRNGLGGWGSNGKQRADAVGEDEKTNVTGSAITCPASTRCVVSREQAPDFDDEVMWIPLPILMSRMLAAGRLP